MINKYKIAIIIPFFGKLPQYFQIFLNSLYINKNTTYIFFTDCLIKAENNIKVYNMKFEEFKSLINKKFDFKIVLDKPYKICDYRPAFGYIFEEYLKDYDFWGHCDCDMIFGCYENFLTDEILEKNNKIFQNGHLTLYKNNDFVNKIFFQDEKIQEIFSSNVSFVYDEVMGIQKKFDELNIKTYKKHPFADISPWNDNFIKVTSWLSEEEKLNFNYKKQLFFWENGQLYWVYYKNKLCFEEIAYLHFQKRNLFGNIGNDDSFLITKLGLIPMKKEKINKELVDKYNRINFFKEINAKINYFKFRIKHKLEALKNEN